MLSTRHPSQKSDSCSGFFPCCPSFLVNHWSYAAGCLGHLLCAAEYTSADPGPLSVRASVRPLLTKGLPHGQFCLLTPSAEHSLVSPWL